jgi:hypothetical protein
VQVKLQNEINPKILMYIDLYEVQPPLAE